MMVFQKISLINELINTFIITLHKNLWSVIDLIIEIKI